MLGSRLRGISELELVDAGGGLEQYGEGKDACGDTKCRNDVVVGEERSDSPMSAVVLGLVLLRVFGRRELVSTF